MPVSEPRYRRIQKHIELLIAQRRVCEGERIPSEREIARQFGVSQMTVNRAIQELVREGVLVRRVGSGTYVRARHPSVRTTDRATVVMVPPFAEHLEEDTYLRWPFHAFRDRAIRDGYTLVVEPALYEGYEQVVRRYPDAGFIFLIPDEKGYDTLHRLLVKGVPFVVLGASWKNAPFACVDSDNIGGARMAVGYLLRLGHERIAYVNGKESATNCRDRLQGYLQAMEERGIAVEEDWIVRPRSNRHLSEEARHHLTSLLLRRDGVTAFLCAGYYLTLEVLSLIRTLRLRVPEDVSIISFDDPSSAAHLQPPLTVVRQPLYAMGERAVDRLLNLMRSPANEPGGVEYLPVELVVRNSCERVPG
ncbi:MAG: LacI family transcriptional regulator [Armatimonadota bacterium]|nr:MAG: LacI family transcriptional regulator [Armatimonadota bacterium]